MERQKFIARLENEILIWDGSYGTQFFKKGFGDIPGEILNLKHPEVVEELHRNYIEAGADIILTNTFSANRPKLASLGYEDSLGEINRRAVEIAHRASDGRVLVFGDISSTGHFPTPMGDMDFEDSVRAYQEQADILCEAGVDGFLVETMSDIKELKAAVYGIRNITSQLPIVAMMTFDSSMRTVTGTSVRIFGTTFQDLDVDVLGMNCTLGPEEMLDLYQELAQHTSKPISIKPNAGKPEYDGERLTYNVKPEYFALQMEDFIERGANIVGGCCGTSPEFVKVMNKMLKKRRPVKREVELKQALASRTVFSPIKGFTVIGEKINPASREEFQDEITAGNYQTVYREASLQEKAGGDVLDLNLGIEKMLDEDDFRQVTIGLDQHSSYPISFDIQNNDYLESALREYPGRPLINSARVTEKSLGNKIRLLKEYGGMLILLAMGNEIPKTAEERYAKIMEGIGILEENGISRDRVFADPLVLTIGNDKDSSQIVLETVKLLSKEGIKTTMGLSNLSFGMADRSYLNGAFLAQAIEIGLTSAIMNPYDPFVMGSLTGALGLNGEKLTKEGAKLSDNQVVEALLAGDLELIQDIIDKKLKKSSATQVSEEVLGQAMEEIGNLYTHEKIFLPDLLLASETAQPVFDELDSQLSEEKNYKGKVIMATVEGDVHDIGKKIVGAVLKSSGYQVIDLGKDIPAADILQAVKEESPDIVGLSAMMTTTVGKIKDVALLFHDEEVDVKLIAGGASMTQKLADKYGCDGYAEDASRALKLCEKLME